MYGIYAHGIADLARRGTSFWIRCPAQSQQIPQSITQRGARRYVFFRPGREVPSEYSQYDRYVTFARIRHIASEGFLCCVSYLVS
jgi:hypothetical protein